MYDVIVVGARCAGASTAMLLARAGHRVLLVDRAQFPRDTLSTLYIQQRGVAQLKRWGLLDRVAELCPALDRVSYRIGDVRLEGCSRPFHGVQSAYAPRRHTLDALLAEAAVADGVEFRPGSAVAGLVWDDGRVAGVRLQGRDRTEVTERARLVVGADGMRSTVAALTGAPTLTEHAPQTCVYYTFWESATDHFELYEAEGQWIGAVPTNDGLTLVQAYFPQSAYSRVRGDALAAYLENVRTAAPDLHARMLDAGRVERLYGTGEQRNFFRTAAGPGWVLVGDAGHHRDSITAKGITHAFIQAQLLTDCLSEQCAGDLDDRVALDAALERFARERHAALIDDYHDTLSTARLSTPPHRVAMFREIAGDPQRTEDFFSAMGGAPKQRDPGDSAESMSRAVDWMKEAVRRRRLERQAV